MRSPFALRSALVALLPAALLFSPLPTQSAHRPGPVLSVSSWLYASKGLVERRLRADFESPELLVLAYDSDWEPSLERILSAARGRAEVAIAPVAEDVDRAYLRKLARRPGVVSLDTVLDTAWVRDFAPLQQRDALGSVFWYDFPYSDERPLDDAFPELISRRWQARYERAWFPMDGGGVISNGEGLCAMTELSVADTNLDAASRSDISLLLSELGCESIVVVPELPNEETGHVDMVAQFVAPDALIVASASPAVYPEVAEALDEAARRLRRAGRALGRKLSITRVPYEVNGETHLTYVNGTALDHLFLVPDYDTVDRSLQARAYAALRRAMPDRTLVPVKADAMIDRGGAVHCITAGLNPPAAALRRLRGATAARDFPVEERHAVNAKRASAKVGRLARKRATAPGPRGLRSTLRPAAPALLPAVPDGLRSAPRRFSPRRGAQRTQQSSSRA